MLSSVAAEVDFIEELRLRRWVREHYVPLPSANTPGIRSFSMK